MDEDRQFEAPRGQMQESSTQKVLPFMPEAGAFYWDRAAHDQMQGSQRPVQAGQESPTRKILSHVLQENGSPLFRLSCAEMWPILSKPFRKAEVPRM